MKNINRIAFVMLVLLGSFIIPSYAEQAAPPDRVQPDAKSLILERRGNVIYYNGAIEDDSYKQFDDFIQKNKGVKFSKLIIKSVGGSTVIGRQIGNYIYDNGLDVEVEEMCFSSCANYIFTAGKNKIIQKDSFVGWHGNEHMLYMVQVNEGGDHDSIERSRIIQAMKDSNMPLQSDKVIDSIIKNFQKARIDERKFYKKIAVDIYLPLIGMMKSATQPYLDASGQYRGYTYTIKDMEKFGLRNITYQGDGNYPAANVLEKYKVFLRQVSDADLADVAGIRKLEDR